jgi:iron complex transport system substrate-binding protein
MKYQIIIVLALLVSVTGSCGKKKEKNTDSGTIIEANSVAGRFSLQKNDSCTILTISDPWQGAKSVRHVYYLVGKDKNLKVDDDPAFVIQVPVTRLICTSTTHLAMVSALGEEEAVSGISGAGYIYDETISEKIKSGLIRDVGFETGLNSELLIKCNPDLIMMYGIGSESAGQVARVKELGYKVMFNADYLETDPLGKAEWIKVFGALFCREKKADSIFASVCESYMHLKNSIELNTSAKPVVLLGMPFRDTWFISPGNSYISNLIRDAGGKYMWQDTESSVSMPYSLESVYLKSLKADYWINTGSAGSKNEIASFDGRLSSIPAFKNGNIYNNNKRISPGGGNDYWESGAINPHLILKDIASILHPELFREYELYYYRKIE